MVGRCTLGKDTRRTKRTRSQQAHKERHQRRKESPSLDTARAKQCSGSTCAASAGLLEEDEGLKYIYRATWTYVVTSRCKRTATVEENLKKPQVHKKPKVVEDSSDSVAQQPVGVLSVAQCQAMTEAATAITKSVQKLSEIEKEWVDDKDGVFSKCFPQWLKDQVAAAKDKADAHSWFLQLCSRTGFPPAELKETNTTTKSIKGTLKKLQRRSKVQVAETKTALDNCIVID